ncbi:hypothetical protein BG011_003799, partial [Mortierella polycephala]
MAITAILRKTSPFHRILESLAENCIGQLDPDTQKTVVALLDQGISVKNVASRLNVGVATVSKLCTQFLPHLKRQPGGRPGILSNTDKHAITRKLLSGELKTGKETF